MTMGAFYNYLSGARYNKISVMPLSHMRVVILAHNTFTGFGGKTARGIYFYSPHHIVAIIDKIHAGKNASELFPGRRNVPIYGKIEDVKEDYDTVIIGYAPVGGRLTPELREDIRYALKNGKTVISGLHDFLNDDPEFKALAEKYGATIKDVRRPPQNLRVADGQRIDSNVVLVAGTDCNIGKMVTAVELKNEVLKKGINAGFVATGQTGVMIGCDAGAVIDRIPGDFMAGVVEDLVRKVCDKSIVFVEGQGDLLHPAYSSVTLAILHGSQAKKIILAHDPKRKWRLGFNRLPIPSLEKAIEAYETMASIYGGKVVAISIYGESMNEKEIKEFARYVKREYDLPAADVLRGNGASVLLDAVL